MHIFYKWWGLKSLDSKKKDIFFGPQRQGQGIMVSEFIFPFGHLNLALLSPKKKEEVLKKSGLMYTKLVEIFEYEKNNNEYWDRTKLHQQVVNKALPIAETLYSSYSLLFFFDNTTSHLFYVKDVLYV